jgi:hypothetical protein
MATNLVSSVMQYLTPDLIAKLAPAFGIDANVAQKVISAGVPAILASFAKVAATPEGVQNLSDKIKQQNSGFLTQIATAAAGGGGQKAIADTGSSLLSQLLGGNSANALVSAVSNFAGINQDAGKSMLGFLGPVVVGALGQEQRASGLNANGLANLLYAQKDQIAAAMPSGLAKSLDARGLLDTPRQMAGAASEAADDATDYLTARAGAASAAARRVSSSSWPYWLIGGLVALGVLSYLYSLHNPQVAEDDTQSKTQLADNSGGQVPAVNSADLSADLTSSVDNLRSTLQGITDPASARAALPKLHEATAQFDKIGTLASQLPPSSRQGLASLLESWMPALNQLCDRVLSRPELANVAKPTIEALRTKLEVIAQT